MARNHACDRCKRRKVRCDGDEPCSQCCKASSPCKRQTLNRRPGPRVAKRPANTETDLEVSHNIGRVRRSVPQHEIATLSGSRPEEDAIGDSICSPGTIIVSAGTVPYPVAQSPAFSLGSVDLGAVGFVWSDFLTVRKRLNSHFDSSRSLFGNIEDVAHKCIDIFFQYLFPNTPIAHEPTLRASVSLLSVQSANDLPEHHQTISSVRCFTLITALCAHIISVVPESLSQKPKSLSVIFFEASRSMLRAYEGYDLEHPDSTSLTIRMWHSSCAQNTTGKVGASWHYHTEACCLAQRLRLFDETSITRPSVLESQLLRVNFWHLYLAEKTQVAFRTRPPIIDEKICYGGITLLQTGEKVVPFLSSARSEHQGQLENRIFLGFHLRRRISASAAALIEDIVSFSQVCGGHSAQLNGSDQGLDELVERYLAFTALVNEVPPWVMYPDRGGDSEIENEQIRAYQVTCFWAQRINIMTIFQCLRLLILQACIDHNLPTVVGLSDNPLAWASRKLEIIREFLHDLQGSPFVCVEAQGETTVDKVRRIGTILLELLHNSSNATIKVQAETLFKSLLDILSRLDSKACEDL